MTLDGAWRCYLEAKAEYDRAYQACARWTEAFGVSIWREGHPLDRMKQRSRRAAYRALAGEQRALIRAMHACPSAGALQ